MYITTTTTTTTKTKESLELTFISEKKLIQLRIQYNNTIVYVKITC